MAAAARVLTCAAALCTAACATLRAVHQSDTGPRLIAEGTPYADRDGDTLFGVPVLIHGRALNFVLDHGTNGSLISDGAMDSLHAPHRYANARRTVVLTRRHPADVLAVDTTADVVIQAGDVITEYWGDFSPIVLDSLRVGRSLQRDFHVADEQPDSTLAPFHGLFGLDLMSQFDIEFDVAARTVRLYERVPPSRVGRDRAPPWLPRGMTSRDCAAAAVNPGAPKAAFDSAFGAAAKQAVARGTDTTGGAAEAVSEAIAAVGQQFWNQQQMLLPVELNGSSTLAEFDSGIHETIINWPEAARLGLTRTSAGVSPRAEAYTRFGIPNTSYIADVAITIHSDRTLQLSRTPIRISDYKFTSPTSGPESVPKVLIGLDQFRDRVLFLSYSTGRVCVGRPRR